jgi:hypothetical protein
LGANYVADCKFDQTRGAEDLHEHLNAVVRRLTGVKPEQARAADQSGSSSDR